MSGFYKLKYILLIVLICFPSGCGTVNKNTTGSVPSQKPEDTKVTDKAGPVGTEASTDVTDNTDEAKLKEAISCIQNKKYPQAIGLLSQIKDSVKAEDLLEQLRYIISGAYIANLGAGIAAIDNDGKVKIITDNSIYEYYQYNEVSDWVDIKYLSYAHGRLDALDKDGVIHSTRDTDTSYDYVVDQLKSYTDLSAISTDYDNYVLLSRNGNIYAYSAKYSDTLNTFQDRISTWKDVVDVVTGQLRIAALKKDGTVYVADYNKYLNPSYDYLYDEIAGWTNIVAISSASIGPIAGLKSDGTVVISTSYITGTRNNNFYYVSDWNDIIAISKSSTTLLGLKSDGTVVATGDNEQEQLDVSGWTDIVAVAAGNWISIGLKSDGTLVIAGKTEEGVTTPDVSGVNNLYVPVVTY